MTHFPDSVLVHVLGNFHSTVNLSVVFDYLYKAGIGPRQAAIVENCVRNLKVNAEFEVPLDELNYPITGRLPRCNTLLRNISSGNRWDKHLRERQCAFLEPVF